MKTKNATAVVISRIIILATIFVLNITYTSCTEEELIHTSAPEWPATLATWTATQTGALEPISLLAGDYTVSHKEDGSTILTVTRARDGKPLAKYYLVEQTYDTKRQLSKFKIYKYTLNCVPDDNSTGWLKVSENLDAVVEFDNIVYPSEEISPKPERPFKFEGWTKFTLEEDLSIPTGSWKLNYAESDDRSPVFSVFANGKLIYIVSEYITTSSGLLERFIIDLYSDSGKYIFSTEIRDILFGGDL